MNRVSTIPQRWRWRLALGMGALGAWAIALPSLPPAAIAQTAPSLCPPPALTRVITHSVAAGETVESIAAAYNLLPVTILAMNPAVPSAPPVGTALRIPPFNGVEVTVRAGQTWQDLATAYRTRADVLFEVNGCPATLPSRIFVPGVSWLLDAQTPAETSATQAADTDPLSSYPLSVEGVMVGNYGWRTDAAGNELVFSSGVTLEVPLPATVQAAGSGTVAYVGVEAGLGLLIVINHEQGLQTRYAQVVDPTVKAGDRVRAGQAIALPVARTDDTAGLYFEVRTNSALGWVARDPGDYLPELAIR